MFQKSNTAFYYLFSDLLIKHVKYYEIGMNTASMQITKTDCQFASSPSWPAEQRFNTFI